MESSLPLVISRERSSRATIGIPIRIVVSTDGEPNRSWHYLMVKIDMEFDILNPVKWQFWNWFWLSWFSSYRCCTFLFFLLLNIDISEYLIACGQQCLPLPLNEWTYGKTGSCMNTHGQWIKIKGSGASGQTWCASRHLGKADWSHHQLYWRPPWDLEFLILDEADRLLDLGFQDEVWPIGGSAHFLGVCLHFS